MKSTARAELARLMAESGKDGVLVVPTSGGRLGEAGVGANLPFGSIAFPPCQCAEHRAGRGRPDTAIRLGEPDRRSEVLTARPAFSAVCLSGGDAKCGARSGEQGSPDAVRAWLRQHADATGHRHYRRTRTDHVALDATTPRRATRHCVGVAEVAGP
ncbi:hypothetical protein AB0I22_17115 [Streptomyces sp. NPDC050610]|uniref:DUF7848 domain-containing protein n=1 Tax=Streptomyces sp. NPDC050610 TaxID=3157097 RepID=UPI00342515B7